MCIRDVGGFLDCRKTYHGFFLQPGGFINEGDDGKVNEEGRGKEVPLMSSCFPRQLVEFLSGSRDQRQTVVVSRIIHPVTEKGWGGYDAGQATQRPGWRGCRRRASRFLRRRWRKGQRGDCRRQDSGNNVRHPLAAETKKDVEAPKQAKMSARDF